MYFTKMQGTGNDFVVIDDTNGKFIGEESKIAKKLCNRRFGIGADGILLVRKSDISDIEMDIINADGSCAAMCGNGIRCFAKYVYDNKIVSKDIINIETGDGIKVAHLKIKDNKVIDITIDMGKFSLEPKDIPANSRTQIINKKIAINDKEYIINSIRLGVPHTVVMCKLDDIDVKEGEGIEKYELFEEGTNVNFCEVIDEDIIKVKTWERGAGPTLACGTGSCASFAISNLFKYVGNKAKIIVPGGELIAEFKGDNVFMTGTAETVFSGNIIV